MFPDNVSVQENSEKISQSSCFVFDYIIKICRTNNPPSKNNYKQQYILLYYNNNGIRLVKKNSRRKNLYLISSQSSSNFSEIRRDILLFARKRTRKMRGRRGGRFASLSKIRGVVEPLRQPRPRLLCLRAESTKGYPYLIKLLLPIDCQTWGPGPLQPEDYRTSPRSHLGHIERLLSNLANLLQPAR